jgi:hypothetical protein
MQILFESIAAIKKNISFYFLNMILLIANVLVGFYTHSYSIMFSALAAITVCTYIYDADHAAINMQFMDNIVILSILIPTAFLWFQHGHPTRIYAGFILLWAFGLYILHRLINIKETVTTVSKPVTTIAPILTKPTNYAGSILAFLASYGHFIFNVEWAMLVLL